MYEFGSTRSRTTNLIDFMSHALAQEEGKVGSQAFDNVAGLSGNEFLMAQSIGNTWSHMITSGHTWYRPIGLFVVANDTNSTFLSSLLYELSLNVDVQQRLQASILILQCHLLTYHAPHP